MFKGRNNKEILNGNFIFAQYILAVFIVNFEHIQCITVFFFNNFNNFYPLNQGSIICLSTVKVERIFLEGQSLKIQKNENKKTVQETYSLTIISTMKKFMIKYPVHAMFTAKRKQ